METNLYKKISGSYTVKGIFITIMALFLLIPGVMIQELIRDRQQTKNEAVKKIDSKWSYAQTIGPPILSIPFKQTSVNSSGESVVHTKTLNITAESIDIQAKLFPEERYYGIYKTILYKSSIIISGSFSPVDKGIIQDGELMWSDAFIKMGVSDLRGFSEEIDLKVNNNSYRVNAGGYTDMLLNEVLIAELNNLPFGEKIDFRCAIELKGSRSINFLPTGRTTNVTVSGEWGDPGFIGNYTPEYSVGDGAFEAKWEILRFNRNIPEKWVNNEFTAFGDLSFGVDLIDPVDIYQLNMRSAKYAILFIVLTFVLFFFVEVFTRKAIHPAQYLLVGIALIIFYTLLLSFSETLGFGLAYLISALATTILISVYGRMIFKNTRSSLILAVLLSVLYAGLYVILQLKESALMVGSIGLFVIMGIIMYLSTKADWYSEKES